MEPALEVKIPTPITVHLDKCKQCREDLETIRQLNLSHKQLYRLSRLFAGKPGEDDVSCSQVQNAIPAVVSMNFNETNREFLKHLCICPDCFKIIYQRREEVRNKYLHTKKEPKVFLCKEISTSDYFDYVVPYGLDPATDQYVNFRQSFTSHSSTCPICLTRMQQLHNTIFGIAERAESGVVTIYHIDEPAKTETVENSDNVYVGFPIKVEVVEHKDEVITEQPDSIINIVTKRKIPAINVKPLFKVGIAAAAIILIATAIFLNVPTAKATTLERIYKAIEKIRNVHISSFVPDKKEPVQEQWVSRTLNVNMIKSDKESVLYDVVNKAKKSKHLDSDLIETTILSAEMASRIQNTIDSSLGLLPFNSMSEIPKDAEWKRVDDKNVKIPNKIEVYDLVWVEKNYESHPVSKKWRFFVDPDTNLPQRLEIYQKSVTNDEYNLRYTIVVKYLDDSEMQKIVEKVSF